MDEENRVGRVSPGLNKHIQEKVRLEWPDTMVKALEVALRVEALDAELHKPSREAAEALAIYKPIPKRNERFKGECFFCNKVGHKAADCFKKNGKKDKKGKFGEKKPQDPVNHHKIEKPQGMVISTMVDDSEPSYEVLKSQLEEMARRHELLQSGIRFEDEKNGVRSLAWPKMTQVSEIADSVPCQYSQSLGNSFITAHIPIRANGIPYAALVDTGANITVASRNILKGLGIVRLQAADNDNAVGFGGNEVSMIGSAIVRFQIGSQVVKQRVHFTNGHCMPDIDGSYQFIFGNDLLSRLPIFMFDYQQKMFHVGDDAIPFGRAPGQNVKPRNYQVKVSEDTIIPAGTEKYVKCSIDASFGSEKDVVLMIDSKIGENDLFVSPAVVMASNAMILVSNPTEEDKTISTDVHAAVANRISTDGNVLYCF